MNTEKKNNETTDPACVSSHVSGSTYYDDYYDDLIENSPNEYCPKCGRGYDDIDFDYQMCSKCGWDADEECYKPDTIHEPNDEDYLNGDADIFSGEWL